MRRRPSFSSTSVGDNLSQSQARGNNRGGYASASSRPELISRVDLSEMLGSADAADMVELSGPMSVSQDFGGPSAYSPAPSPVTVFSAASNAGTIMSAATLTTHATVSPPRSVKRPPPAVPNVPVVSSQAKALAEKHHGDGYKLRREGDFEGAIIEYTKALEADGRHFKALFNRGFAYDKLGASFGDQEWYLAFEGWFSVFREVSPGNRRLLRGDQR
jgi:tetratricopeptide (TPR) repeat protein